METLRLSTDRAELDVALIHHFLSRESYWALGMPLATLQIALENSLCFGAFLGAHQVGFARVVTDRATAAHLKDVFVLPEHRGRGFGRQIVQTVMAHPDLQCVAFTLGTADAHALYRAFGFVVHPQPERQMIRLGSFLPAAPNPPRSSEPD
jgi:GNAT superfamily N-acetyltransferase